MAADPHVAAVIGHADDPDMVQLCIRHHLAVGARHVIVALNNDDAVLPAALAGDERVRGRPAAAAADGDPFLYFSGALRDLSAWAAPDWVLFTDSDEFWVPQGGTLAGTQALSSSDLLIVERFNTPVLRGRDGGFQVPDLLRPKELPVIVTREPLDDAYLAGDPTTPWIMALDAPKLMVRPDLVERVETGAHSIVSRQPDLRWSRPDDLLIVHAPFTTEARFRRKVASVKAAFASHGGRFDPRQAWHWRYWLTLDDEALAAEFRRQTFRVSALPALRAQGVVATPAEHFSRLSADAAVLAGDALHEFLGRAIMNYERPAPATPPAAAPPPPPPAEQVAPPPPAQPSPAQPLPVQPPPAPPSSLPPAKGQEAATPYVLAPVRHVERIEDCVFYHCMDLPGHGEVTGQWDLRGRESEYLGGVDFAGRTVLEIGPASGCLSFWMERQGATVTSFDLDEHQAWDIVPFAGVSYEENVANRRRGMRMINNGWWFARERLGSRANVVYGSVYGLDRLTQTFDTVTINSVLLHLRDPFQALAQAAARTHDQIIVTDVAQEYFAGEPAKDDGNLSMQFIPRHDKGGPTDTWWFVSEYLTREILRILGFREITLTFHRQRFVPNDNWPLYTLVGRR